MKHLTLMAFAAFLTLGFFSTASYAAVWSNNTTCNQKAAIVSGPFCVREVIESGRNMAIGACCQKHANQDKCGMFFGVNGYTSSAYISDCKKAAGNDPRWEQVSASNTGAGKNVKAIPVSTSPSDTNGIRAPSPFPHKPTAGDLRHI